MAYIDHAHRLLCVGGFLSNWTFHVEISPQPRLLDSDFDLDYNLAAITLQPENRTIDAGDGLGGFMSLDW